jgi:hypothetical protein
LAKLEENYSLHDAVTFKIVDKPSFLSNFLGDIHTEYENFENKLVKNPDFTIDIGDFTPDNENSCILDNKYYVKHNYFYCSDSYKTAKWKFEMSGFENGDMKVRIYADNLFTSMIISGFLVDPLINFKLSEKGLSLVHASCVSKDNCGYLFTAQGGGGKTSNALYSVERGFDFLGDNFTIIDNGLVRSFLSPLNVFSFNLAPIVKKNMGRKSKVEYLFKNLLHKVTGLRVVTKINVKDIFSKSLVDISKLDSAFLLIPKNRFKIERIGRKELISHMVANMKLDSFPFIKYMMEYSYIFPKSRMATHWQRYTQNLNTNINNDISAYRVEVPKTYDMSTFEEIWGRIQTGITRK